MNMRAVELLARLASLQTVVAGFMAENAQRQTFGGAMMYGEDIFNRYAALMEGIAAEAKAAKIGGRDEDETS